MLHSRELWTGYITAPWTRFQMTSLPWRPKQAGPQRAITICSALLERLRSALRNTWPTQRHCHVAPSLCSSHPATDLPRPHLSSSAKPAVKASSRAACSSGVSFGLPPYLQAATPAETQLVAPWAELFMLKLLLYSSLLVMLELGTGQQRRCSVTQMRLAISQLQTRFAGAALLHQPMPASSSTKTVSALMGRTW